MKTLEKILQQMVKELKGLTKKAVKLQTQIAKEEKQAKKKVIKKKVAPEKAPKKVSAKKAPVKKATKKAAPKKSAPVKKVSAIGTVLEIINQSKNGVSTKTLEKKSGFNARKISNVLFKLKKQGKVKSEKRGVYSKG